MKIALALMMGLLILSYAIYKWLDIQQFGQTPTAEETEAWQNLSNFDAKTKTFTNLVPGDLRQDMQTWPLLKAYIFGSEIRVPTQKLPTLEPDVQAFLSHDEKPLKWLWLGHSTLYLNIRGKLILVDPVFGPSSSPLSFMVKRFQDPAIALENLPKPQLVLLSHDHYDHLDASTIRFLAGTSARFLVSLGIGARLQSWGIAKERIEELNWHSGSTWEGITFTAVPAQHFSGRGLFDANKTLWVGWILEVETLKLIYSGDTGYAPHFKDIGERYGPFDLAFLECGQYNRMWRYVHMLPEEVIQAAKELKATNISPVHWGMFNLSLHDWFEPIERITRLADTEKIPIWHPRLGELVRFPGEPAAEAWWRQHPDFIRRTQVETASP